MKADRAIVQELVEYFKTHPPAGGLKSMQAIIKKYVERRLKDKKKEVVIVAPYKLSDQEINEVKDLFPIIKENPSTVRCEVDPNLKAGLIIKVGSRVLDLTLESQLSNLERNLKQI